MYFAGIDIGSLTAEAVIVENGSVAASARISVLPNPVDSARAVMKAAMENLGAAPHAVRYTISTGYGREKIQKEGMAQENVSEISCHGVGAHALAPRTRTVIDIGGQDAKVIKLGRNGDLLDFVMNDKCAAGTGNFLEVMCRAMDIELGDMGPISESAKKPVVISSRCSIYAETEVIHYLQRRAPKADIAAGINRAMAERVLALARRVKPEKEVMLTGGVAKNTAVRAELERMLKVKIIQPAIDTQLIGAFGAAILASRKGGAS